MRIYDGDFTVGTLIDECGVAARRESNLPVSGREPTREIDIEKLNRRLNMLPIPEIRRRRRRMNNFYEEVLVSSDPDRGIQFSSLLMILAHHKVINDNKSLRYVHITCLSDIILIQSQARRVLTTQSSPPTSRRSREPQRRRRFLRHTLLGAAFPPHPRPKETRSHGDNPAIYRSRDLH